MNKKIISAFLVSLLIGLQLSAKELPGVPTFGDDFSVSALFVENWIPSKGVRTEDGRAIVPRDNSLTLRRIPEGDFAFTVDITIEKPNSKDIGHCNVTLDGINFLITPKSKPIAHTAYTVPGEKRARGKRTGAIPDFEFGKPCKIMISRKRLGEGYQYSYKVNGNPVDSFFIVMPANGKISFNGYKTNMEIDNFQLYSMKGNGSNNLAVNSSFEHLQEGMPNYMKPCLNGKASFEGKWEDFLKMFAIDTKEKVSGKQSARMTCGEKYPTSNGVETHDVNVVLDRPVTFSVYLKASEDDFPVQLSVWELWARRHSKDIRISKEWQRYSFTVDKLEKKAVVRGKMSFSKPGTVWADDLQIEIGAETTPYMVSSLDKDKFTEAKTAVPIEEDIVLRKTLVPPVIDGEIEALWFKDAVKVDKFFFNGGKTPINKTEAYITCDNDNLYVAVRAYVPDTSKVKGTKYAHDILSTHADDCIEIFLDTTFDRKTYYHLTTGAAGSRTDMGPGRILAWNGTWESAAKINEKTKSIDYEMKFPLESFAGLDMAGKWGINIGRNDTNSKKVYSLTHTKKPNFHLPAIYPAIVFPDGIVDKYKVGFRDLCLISGQDAKISASGTVGNLSENALDAEVRILDATTGALIGQKAVKLERGNTEVVIPVNSADVEAIDGIVKIIVDGKELSSQPKRMILARPLEMYTRYNYYMNEKAAVLVGSLNLPEVDTLTGKIKVAGKTFEVKMEPEFAFDVPLKDIENGEHQITLDVYNGNEKCVTGKATLIKREFKKGATQIDHQRRCLVVDGKPYLVISPFFALWPAPTNLDKEAFLKNTLRLHKEMGYKCFLVGGKDLALWVQQSQEFIDFCAQEGIKIIYWPFESWKNRTKITPEQRFQLVKGDNLIAWLAVDEPELHAKSEEVEVYLDALRKASPYTPVFMNNTIIGIPGRFANLKTDILMLDDYLTNREGRKVIEMIDAATIVWEAAGKEERQPAFYFLVGESLQNHYRELTYAEQIAQTYGVVIAGTRGISYFCSLPLYPENYRASVDVNRELLQLEDVILSIEKTSEAAITDSVVKFMTKKLGDKIYIIALNSDNDRMVDVEITLPAEFKYAKTAEVKFEDRNIKVNNGKISDKFKPLERHVYVVEIDQ